MPNFPDTRFSYADLTLEKFIKNKDKIQELSDIFSTDKNECKKTGKQKLQKFQSIINGHNDNGEESIFKKVQAVRQITKPLGKMIHHLESKKTKASWIFPLFEALMKDVYEFKNNPNVKRCLKHETIENIQSCISRRWLGQLHNERQIVPLKNNIFIVAYLLDPYYSTCEHLNQSIGNDWDISFKEIVKTYYKNHQQENRIVLSAEDELLDILDKRGKWGDYIRERQSEISERMHGHIFAFNVEKVIFSQNLMRPTHQIWKFFGSIKYPIVTPIAMKLSILAVQSANVERACKAHGVIHTKARNRLKNGTVQKLLYCYMNLCLLYNHEKLYEVSNFIESEIKRIDNNGGHDNEIGIGDSSEGEDDITNTIDISQMLNESVTREKLKVPNNNVSTSGILDYVQLLDADIKF